jgi:hypothetical protein
MLGLASAFAGRYRVDVVQGSFLPRQRDRLTAGFLRSECSHMLCIDSDIGFTAENVNALLDARKPIVAGCYARKHARCDIPASPIGDDEGGLIPCSHVPAGFMLIERSVIEHMTKHFSSLAYVADGQNVTGLWCPDGQADGEDVAFCRRLLALGYVPQLHTGVRLRHYGAACYVPTDDLVFA